jgi:hypothetical protein
MLIIFAVAAAAFGIVIWRVGRPADRVVTRRGGVFRGRRGRAMDVAMRQAVSWSSSEVVSRTCAGPEMVKRVRKHLPDGQRASASLEADCLLGT